MGRLVDVRRRTELLDDVVAYLAEHGIAGLSLRPMAKSLSVSVNALVHHFGTKDDIVVAALQRAVDVQDQVQVRWTARNPGLSQAELLRRWWRWINSSSANLASGATRDRGRRPRRDRDRTAGTGAGRSDRALAIEHRATPGRRGCSGGRRRRRGVAREGDVHRPRRRPPRDRRAPPARPRPRGRPRPARPGRVGERGPVRPGHPGASTRHREFGRRGRSCDVRGPRVRRRGRS